MAKAARPVRGCGCGEGPRTFASGRFDGHLIVGHGLGQVAIGLMGWFNER
jgi:hypothetical protein